MRDFDEPEKPVVGDIVIFKIHPQPLLGEPRDVIGRVESSIRGFHAGNRMLSHADGDIFNLSYVLDEIAQGKGPYKHDALEHADACITAMKELALSALDRIERMK